ncbi:trypsin-like peptidase domain-containing protein [Shigella flexneri]
MKKQTQLLSALALSVGLTLSASFQAVAWIPGQVAHSGPPPQSGSNAGKGASGSGERTVKGSASQGQKTGRIQKVFWRSFTGSTCTTLRRFRLRCRHNASKGYVLTNDHVINQAQKIVFSSMMGASLMQSLIGSDDQSDIALLQIQNPSEINASRFADSDKLRVGAICRGGGNSVGLGQIATSGICSALGHTGKILKVWKTLSRQMLPLTAVTPAVHFKP